MAEHKNLKFCTQIDRKVY